VGRADISLSGSSFLGSVQPHPLDENGTAILTISQVSVFQRYSNKNYYLACGIESNGVYHGRCWRYHLRWVMTLNESYAFHSIFWPTNAVWDSLFFLECHRMKHSLMVAVWWQPTVRSTSWVGRMKTAWAKCAQCTTWGRRGLPPARSCRARWALQPLPQFQAQRSSSRADIRATLPTGGTRTSSTRRPAFMMRHCQNFPVIKWKTMMWWPNWSYDEQRREWPEWLANIWLETKLWLVLEETGWMAQKGTAFSPSIWPPSCGWPMTWAGT